MIADKSQRKWGKIDLARLTFRSLARRIDYESGTSKSRFHHDLRVSFGAPDKPCGVGRADANPKLLLNDT